jgi:hypothetical protein
MEPHVVHASYKTGHILPDLMHDLDEFFRHLSRTVVTLDTTHIGDAPKWELWFDRVDPEYLPLQTFGLRRTCDAQAGLTSCGFLLRADMISHELCQEINGFLVPEFSGALLPTSPMGPVM